MPPMIVKALGQKRDSICNRCWTYGCVQDFEVLRIDIKSYFPMCSECARMMLKGVYVPQPTEQEEFDNIQNFLEYVDKEFKL